MSKRPQQVSPFLDAATFISGLPRAFWCNRGKHVRIPFAASRDQIHHRLRFCCDSFLQLNLFQVLFDITSEQLVELKWIILNKHKRWFHSSRVKFPLVSMSASWFLVSMYLIWILGSKLILSNNQSRATLWVLETCLIVGFLPFKIILITASLSSNTYNKASCWEEVTFERIKSTLSKSFYEITFVFELCEVLNELHVGSDTCLSVLCYSDSCFPELRRSDRINQVQVYHPTSILHPRKCFLILLNCAKLKFVSYTSNWLEQTYDFQTSTMFHQM